MTRLGLYTTIARIIDNPAALSKPIFQFSERHLLDILLMLGLQHGSTLTLAFLSC